MLRNIQDTMGDNSIDLGSFLADRQEQQDFDDSFRQLEVYHRIYRLLASGFREALIPYRNNTFVEDKLGDSFLFDVMLNIIMRHMVVSSPLRLALSSKDNRKMFFDSMVAQILAKSVEEFTSFKDPSVWVGDLKELTFTLAGMKVEGQKIVPSGNEEIITIPMKPYLQHMEKVPEAIGQFGIQNTLGFNSGLMLYGDKGSGKSGVLNYVTCWAWNNKWVVIKIPSVYHITQHKSNYVRHEEARLYLQPELAKEVLADIKQTNEHLLDTIPFDQSLYGFYNVSGCHEMEPPAVRNIFNEWTNSHTFDSDKFLLEGELQSYLNDQREWKFKLKEKLPAPKSLRELIDFAEKVPDYTTAILAEVLEQLRHQDKYPTLIACDDFNWFYRRSVYNSFRYDDKVLKGKVPPYHLALCRMFMRMDGHKFKNGFKLVASSHLHLYKHVFTPDKINWPQGFSWKLDGIRLDNFRHAIYHYSNTNLLQIPYITEDVIQQYYVESQGRWGLLLHFIHKRYTCMDISDYKLKRRDVFAKLK